MGTRGFTAAVVAIRWRSLSEGESMSQNISIHLPDDTLVEIDKLSPQGDLSLFISEAIQLPPRLASTMTPLTAVPTR